MLSNGVRNRIGLWLLKGIRRGCTRENAEKKKGRRKIKDSEQQSSELTVALKVERYCHHAVMMIKEA